jgi:LPS export ABC transporter permease LptF/LPS export ABC transporter permease LptG
MRILDRYVMRQVLMPFALGLLVFTFLFIIPELMKYAESYISKGAPTLVIIRLVIALVPMALGLTIPMSLLLGLLITFGRLSTDREFVAMQACGVSPLRLMRPVGMLAVAGCLTTGYVLLVAVPDANQTFREITFNVIATQAEGEVKPRVFYDEFPNIVLYVREIPQSGGWNGVFMADNSSGEGSAIYLARRGRIQIDRQKQTVEVVLEDGTRHTADVSGKYEIFRFVDRFALRLNPDRMFPKGGITKGDREMSVAELRAKAAELQAQGTYPHNQLFEIQKKFSIPAACLVFGLIGVALGVTNRRDGKLANFVIGITIIFAYYILLFFGQSLTKGRMIPPWFGAWLPNIVLGALGLLLFKLRNRVGDRPLRIPVPEALVRVFRPRGVRGAAAWPSILDRYVAMTYARMLGLSAVALASVFYIAEFTELSEKVFKGAATWAMLGMYLVDKTPQYLYYVIPLSVLLAALVTIAMLTKNSELIVMKACGISIYRVAAPMLICAILAGGAMMALEQTVLGASNRKAEAIKHIMRGGSPETFDVLNRRWLMGTDGTVYHYNYFNPRAGEFSGLWTYKFSDDLTRVRERTFAAKASYEHGASWRAEHGWSRAFDKNGETTPADFKTFAESRRTLEPASYFTTQSPDPDFMSYTQLRAYTDRLEASGLDVVKQQVALWRKVSFPFVTIIMTLLAVPFAVTIGRSGAMAGIAAAIAIAIVYWTTISVFAAMGAGGLIAPLLAAWAPNLLFGAGAAYLLLTVRT